MDVSRICRFQSASLCRDFEMEKAAQEILKADVCDYCNVFEFKIYML